MAAWEGVTAVPLTGTLPDHTPIDATSCTDQVWGRIHRSHPRTVVTCRGCHGPMQPKVSSTGLRFFAHDRVTPHCPSHGETLEHLTIKQTLATLIRAVGSAAHLEGTPAVSDRGGWRADVLAVSPTGSRVAFEVQLASMTIAEGQRRTGVYAADRIDTVWVSTRHTAWMTRLPSCRIVDPAAPEPLVDRGLATLSTSNRWEAAGVVPLRRVVAGVLDGTVTTAAPSWIAETVRDQCHIIDDPVILVGVAAAAAKAAADEQQTREREAAAARAAKHVANVRNLYARQARVVQHVAARVAAQAPGRVWLGWPPARWDGKVPIPDTLAAGDAFDAMGAVVGVGDTRRAVRRVAVICPVVSRCTPALGRRWAARQVQVWAETAREAARIAAAVGWDPARINVTGN